MCYNFHRFMYFPPIFLVRNQSNITLPRIHLRTLRSAHDAAIVVCCDVKFVIYHMILFFARYSYDSRVHLDSSQVFFGVSQRGKLKIEWKMLCNVATGSFVVIILLERNFRECWNRGLEMEKWYRDEEKKSEKLKKK